MAYRAQLQQDVEAQRAKLSGNPQQLEAFEAHLAQLQEYVESTIAQQIQPQSVEAAATAAPLEATAATAAAATAAPQEYYQDMFQEVPRGTPLYRGNDRAPTPQEFKAMLALAEEFKDENSGLAFVQMRNGAPAIYLQGGASKADVNKIVAGIVKHFGLSEKAARDLLYSPAADIYGN